MAKISYIKMAAAGNDFIIIDNRGGQFDVSLQEIKDISKRKNLGCDQFIILENSQDADVSMQIFNADASQAEACGNSTRCIGALIIKEKGVEKISIKTIAGILDCWKDDSMISVNMGKPSFEWQKIFHKSVNMNVLPFKYNGLSNFRAIDIGNPHIVSIVEDKKYFKDYFTDISHEILNRSEFINGTNIEYIEDIINKNHIKIRVWERGVGETQSCGTGACAAVVIAAKTGLVEKNQKVKAEFRGGSLWINWQNNDDIIMTGGFQYLGKGEYDQKDCTTWW